MSGSEPDRRGENTSTDGEFDEVRQGFEDTAERRARWPSRGIAGMHNLVDVLIAVAVVVIVAIVGLKVLADSGQAPNSGQESDPVDIAIPSAVTATARPTPSATPTELLPVNALPVGRHSLTVEGTRCQTRNLACMPVTIPLSFSVPAGWFTFGHLYIGKSIDARPGAEAMIYWTTFPDAVDFEACGQWWGPSGGYGVRTLAAAAATPPGGGTELVAGPSRVVVGGHRAKTVAFTVRRDVGCGPGFFYTWRQSAHGGPRWASTRVGDTIRVWIVNADGNFLLIEGDTHNDAGRDLKREVEQIVESMRFG